MSSNITNGTSDDLLRLNYERFVTLIPAVVLFSLYMLMGLVGNSLVCYIIGFKFQSSNQNFLIVWLAIFDLLSCLLGMPHDIVDLRYTLAYPYAIPCKILRFVYLYLIYFLFACSDWKTLYVRRMFPIMPERRTFDIVNRTDRKPIGLMKKITRHCFIRRKQRKR